MAFRSETSPSRATRGKPAPSVPARSGIGGNSSSELIEAPQSRRDPFDPHDFADGGGSGGAEAFRRTPRPGPHQ